jgi:hypothetical protein
VSQGIWACFGHSKFDKDVTVEGAELLRLLQVCIQRSTRHAAHNTRQSKGTVRRARRAGSAGLAAPAKAELTKALIACVRARA